jgi:CopA family copper-resistance protein
MSSKTRYGGLAAPDRRRFVQGFAALGGAVWLAPGNGLAQTGVAELSGDRFDLSIDRLPVNVAGRARTALAVNGLTPGPLLRWREGDTVTLDVVNRLDEPTSIHWHGIRLPSDMDGVPGLSFAGIPARGSFTYRFPVVQGGTYWYHSHSGVQEPLGLFGPIVIEPRGGEAHPHDREHLIMLSDWSDEDPMAIVGALKQQPDYYNYHQRTLGDLFADIRKSGLSAALAERAMWANMRMSPTDILDISGATFTYLTNGRAPAANWTGLFEPGERVRLRFVNAAVGTLFDVRMPGLTMTIVGGDGADLEPVSVDEFRFGPGETYDVIVQPTEAKAYTLFAQAMDRSGYARGTLAPAAGMSAEVPPMDPVPVRTMADMGMSMGGMVMAPAAPPSGGDSMAGMDMSAMDMSGAPAPAATAPPASRTPQVNADGVSARSLKGRPNVDNVAMTPMDRQAEAGDGLDGNGRSVLTYAQLKPLVAAAAPRAPDRELEFRITGNMQRWTWGFNGKSFSESGPVRLRLGERVRFVLVNDTMMEHPIHLHGFLFQVENGQPTSPLKHTLTVKPGERVCVVFDADTPGHWAFHCHLLYHMHMGMFRTVVVA